MRLNYCQYCWPTKRIYHFDLHLGYYTERLTSVFLKPLRFFSKNHLFRLDSPWVGIVRLLSLAGIVSYTKSPDETQLFNRSLIFFKEAQRRGLDITAMRFLGKYKNEFKFTYRGKAYYYEGIPLTIRRNILEIDNKYEIKKLLEGHNIPTASGKLFTNQKEALDFGRALGYPLVVKPNTGSLSYHSTYPVNSDQALLRAIAIARKYRPDFIVEQFVAGNLYRATVVGRKHVFICQKERANVIGDGVSTIKHLIQAKNLDPWRGEIDQRNASLHRITIDERLKANLRFQNLSLKTILPTNKKIYVHDKFILSSGCDIINCTAKTHRKNKELFLKIAKILATDLVGIDIICEDIRKPYTSQRIAVIETNSLPYIDMHQYPSHGRGDPVAKVVWDVVLDGLHTRE